MSGKRFVTSVIIGNALEWYDYILYAHFAVVISVLFFPSADSEVSLISTFAVFAVGFISRPIGAVLFGFIGDTYGRKVALSIAIILIALPTTLMGLLPSYQTIGIFAPILMVILRILQGISIGGEFGASAVYLMEMAPKNKKGLYSSITITSLATGVLIGSLTGLVFEMIFTNEEIIAFWWRIPFIFSAFIGLFGFYVRKKLAESEEFLRLKGKVKEENEHGAAFKELFFNHGKSLFFGVIIYLPTTIGFYSLNVFLKTYLVKFLGYNANFANVLSILSVISMLFTSVIFGYITRNKNQEKSMFFGSVIFLILVFPIFMLYLSKIEIFAIVAAILSGVGIASASSSFSAVFCNLFETKYRSTGVSLASTIPAVLAGGTSPMLLSSLMFKFDNLYIPGYYCFGCFLLSVVVLYKLAFSNTHQINLKVEKT